MTKEELMRRAIELSADSVRNGGGPFGAVIARNGEIIAEGSNGVTLYNDPTAHAEVSTIRKACQKLNTFDLSGCEIYTSCEPCPMCFGAIYWAHLDKIYYANDRKDAADIGFDDDFIYQEIAVQPQYRKKPSEILLRNEALEVFKQWTAKADKTEYWFSPTINQCKHTAVYIDLFVYEILTTNKLLGDEERSFKDEE